MKINATKSNGMLKAKLQEALDIGKVADARDSLLQILNSGSNLRFDLSSLTEIDTAGVQLVLAIQKEAHSLGKECRFVHPSPTVEEAFRTLGCAGVFDESILTAQAKG